MNARTKSVIGVLGIAAAFAAHPGATFAAGEKSGGDARLSLSQAGFCDGSVRSRLEPGTYDVHFATSADGSVRATLSQGGVRKCETRAIAAPGSNEVLIGLLLPAVQLPAVQVSGAKAPAIQLPGAPNKTPTAAPRPGQQGPITQGTMGTQSSK